jgi:hypothetical protein
MSDTNRVDLRIGEEVTYGEIPAIALAPLPFSGSSDLGFTPDTVVSELIRSDRQISDLVLVGGSVGGSFDSELANDIHDTLLEAVLFSPDKFSDDAQTQDTASDVDIAAPSGGFTQLSIATAATAATWAVGDWIRMEGWATEGNNGFFEITSILNPTAPLQVVLRDPGSMALEAVGLSITVTRAAKIQNGVNQRSFTLERFYSDQVAPLYEYLRGMIAGTFSLTASSSSIVNTSFGFIGKNQFYDTTRDSGVSDGSDVPFSVYNASSNVGALREGGLDVGPSANLVMEASIEIENNLRERNAVGFLGAASVGSGEFSVTGTLQTYFDDSTLADKLVANSESSFAMAFENASGETLLFHLPRLKFSEGIPEVAGKNEDVMLNLGYQAILDPTLNYTMSISKFDS